MSMKRKVIVTGISGQDGRIVLDKLQGSLDWQIIGITHNINSFKKLNINCSYIASWDFKDPYIIEDIVKKHRPYLVINFASFTTGIGMFDKTSELSLVNGMAVVHLLEAIKKFSPETKFLQSGSSEIFGDTSIYPQDEKTPMLPRSPYGAAKLFAHNMVKIYRKRYSLHASNLIFYNHESVYRTESFVTKKIVKGAIAIKKGLKDSLELFDLKSSRDWSYAPDFIDGMFLVADQSKPSDYIFASGKLTTVEKLCEIVFNYLGLNYMDYVKETNPSNICDNKLLGNPKKLEALGFKRSKNIETMLFEMIDYELKNYEEKK